MSIAPIQGSSFLSDTQKSKSLVGTDIMGYCNKCMSNTLHTIVTLIPGAKDKPDKVQCNSCKSERKFRPAKKLSELRAQEREAKNKVAVDDDETELDLDQAAPIFAGDEPKKKAKPKAKKAKEESYSPSKNAPTIPLSLQGASSEDISLFNNKFSAYKSHPAEARDYRASERFSAGDVINHKTFGIGFVVAETGLNKVEILFKDGRKLLVCKPKSE